MITLKRNHASTNIFSNKKKQSVQFAEEVANQKTNLDHKDITEEQQVTLANDAGSLEKTENNNISNDDNEKFQGNDDLSILKNNERSKNDNIEEKELSTVQKVQKIRNNILSKKDNMDIK